MDQQGINLLFLTPSEAKFKLLIQQQKIEFSEKLMKLKNAVSVRSALSVLIAHDP